MDSKIAQNASSQQDLPIEPPLLTVPKEDSDSIQSHWKKAVKQCEEKLVTSKWENHPNKLALAKFQSWQDLMDDLRTMAKAEPSNRFIEQIIPSMRTMRRVFPILIAAVAIPSQSREVSLILGVCYLGVTVSNVSVQLLI